MFNLRDSAQVLSRLPAWCVAEQYPCEVGFGQPIWGGGRILLQVVAAAVNGGKTGVSHVPQCDRDDNSPHLKIKAVGTWISDADGWRACLKVFLLPSLLDLANLPCQRIVIYDKSTNKIRPVYTSNAG